MANGPFGNPLSTGIALSFEVDMTPYRQMHKRKLLAAEEKKQQRAKQQKELQDILKNVTVDTSKIHDRYKDDAMNEYASTINDIMSMYKEGNVSGVYQRINKFNNGINSYVDATENFKAYVKSDGSKTMKNEELIRAMNDVENVDDVKLADMFESDVDYSDGKLMFTTFDRLDVDGYINKLTQGAEKGVMYDASGKPVVTGRLGETNEVEYREVVKNPDAIINSTLGWMLDPGNRASTIRMLVNEYPELTPSNLDQRDPQTGETLLESRLKDYVAKRSESKLYGTRIGKMPQEKESKGWTFGGGGAKSPNWEVNKVSNIPVSLTDEVGGSLSGWKVDYIKQTGVSEIERNIELGKGAYFAEGGSKIQKVSDAASGLGKIIKGTPAGIYVRDDKKGGQLWVAYETNYIPPTDKLMEGFERYYDPNKKDKNGNTITKEEQKQAFMATRMSEDKDLVSKTTKRIVYVPIKSDSEKIEFRTTMGMSGGEFNQLIDMIGASPATGTQSSSKQTYTIKGKTYSEEDLMGMGYTVDQIEPYKD